MDKASLPVVFVTAGLSRLVKDIDALSRESIRLSTTPVDESTLAIGASKLGGLPDLPSGTLWPQWKDTPQSFIAQIRLSDAHTCDTDGVLPAGGMLWFFYDAQQQTFGADPADRGGWSVIFQADEHTSLERTPAPATLPIPSQFTACSMSFASEITLSQQPKLELPNYDWTETEQQQYETLLSTFPDVIDHGSVHHRLLGNPETIQDDMRQEAQLASHGVTDVNDPRAAKLLKGAMNWHLLLQIDSDDKAGMAWGNTGMLYYWIEKADLQACRFDHTWLVLQSE